MRKCVNHVGSLTGTALGDSLGLPSEGMSRRRIQRRWSGPLEQRFLFGRGMLSDDTEHSIFVSQALLECGHDVGRFQKSLARKLRWWIAALPAGVGLATARAILKLWLGFKPGKNGVFSAGNGPVMRAPIIGVFFADDVNRRMEFVRASTLLTHTDPKACEAAMMAADCAAFAVRGETDENVIFDRIREIAKAPEWAVALDQIQEAVANRKSVKDFAGDMGFGQGVSGYAVHTMIMVLFIWLRHRGDFRTMICEAIECGGDTDSVAAIVGGIAGAETLEFDPRWTGRICDYPHSMDYLIRLGNALGQSTSGHAGVSSALFNPLILPRNVIFLTVVLFHGFRRLFPPY
jgi:ADP-ribosyl-[dinitrogen reductase] hydrolase